MNTQKRVRQQSAQAVDEAKDRLSDLREQIPESAQKVKRAVE